MNLAFTIPEILTGFFIQSSWWELEATARHNNKWWLNTVCKAQLHWLCT